MIRPRTADPAADPALIAGVLGVVALIRELEAVLAQLADDDAGDGGDDDADGPPDTVLDVVLGLAALARAVAAQGTGVPAAPVAGDAETVREPIELPLAELLR